MTAILLSRQWAELWYFVSRETDPLFAKLRSDCFEAMAHEKLAAGDEKEGLHVGVLRHLPVSGRTRVCVSFHGRGVTDS